ncbi:MAG: LPS assembly lipoprotein LptE [Planctomycetaceae bacterium]
MRLWGGVIAMVVIHLLAGCGYQIGSPHPPQYRTVAVPMFKSNSYRRGFEERLTEAVQREIQSQSHLRLSKEPYADTRLVGTIVEVRKDVLGETSFDDPRELQLSIAVELKWEDARTGEILSQNTIPVNGATTHLISTGEFAPEVGHSLATATQSSVDGLARQIVEQMESPW